MKILFYFKSYIIFLLSCIFSMQSFGKQIGSKVFFSKPIVINSEQNKISVLENKKERSIKQNYPNLSINISDNQFSIIADPYTKFSGRILSVNTYLTEDNRILCDFTALNYDQESISSKTEFEIKDSSHVKFTSYILSGKRKEKELLKFIYYIETTTLLKSFNSIFPEINSATFVRLKKGLSFKDSKRNKILYSGLRESSINLRKDESFWSLNVDVENEGNILSSQITRAHYNYESDFDYNTTETYYFIPKQEQWTFVIKNDDLDSYYYLMNISELTTIYEFEDILVPEIRKSNNNSTNPLALRFTDEELKSMAIIKVDRPVDLDILSKEINVDRRLLGKWNFDYFQSIDAFNSGTTKQFLIRIPKEKLELFLEKKSVIVK